MKSTYVYSLAACVGTGLISLFAPRGSLLPALLFWVAALQGAIALAAAAEVTGARWIKPLRTPLLDLTPLLLIFPVTFLILARRLSVYPWVEHPTGWLNPTFFVVRNVLMLLITWFLAHRFAQASRRESAQKGTLAVVYILAFVANQSLIAFDRVMSFEYPWISTLFGAYFFVEALYIGIAITAVLASTLYLRGRGCSRDTLRDTATLLFGFALLWAGQFFAQYLVIWYGNIPEEVSFLSRRVLESPLKDLSVLVLGLLFFAPFVVLLSREARTQPWVVTATAFVVASGVFVERLVGLLPVVDLRPVVVALECLLLGAVFVLTIVRATPLSGSPAQVSDRQ